jgi:hypothetical protein
MESSHPFDVFRSASLLLPLVCWVLAGGGFGSSCTVNPSSTSDTVSCSVDQTSIDTSGWVGINSNVWGDGEAFSTLASDRFIGLAQSFQPLSGVSGNEYQLLLQMVSSATDITLSGTLTAAIESDIGEGPTGVVIASATADVQSLSRTSAALVTFTSTATFSLTAYQTYWLTLSSSSAASSKNFVAWLGSKTDPLTTGKASAKRHSTGLWDSSNLGAGRDFAFRLNCKSVSSTPTPSPSPTPSASATGTSLTLKGGLQ